MNASAPPSPPSRAPAASAAAVATPPPADAESYVPLRPSVDALPGLEVERPIYQYVMAMLFVLASAVPFGLELTLLANLLWIPRIRHTLTLESDPSIAFLAQTAHPRYASLNRGLRLQKRWVACVVVLSSLTLATWYLSARGLPLDTLRDALAQLASLCALAAYARKVPVPAEAPARPNTTHLRRMFRRLQVAEHKARRGAHSHPLTAAVRDAASATVDRFILESGCTPYVVQPSRADVSKGFPSSLIHYWPKDAHSEEHSDPIPSNPLFKMFNVDYYIDWAQYLWMAQPFMVYTFTPLDPCGSHNEYSWSVGPDQRFTTRVNGGGVYNHELWDYETDNITCVRNGVAYDYSVERVRHDTHFSFVLLTPTATRPTDEPDSLSLERLKPVRAGTTMAGDREVAQIHVQDPAGSYISAATPGTNTSVRFPLSLVDHVQARHAARGLTLHDLNTIVPPYFTNREDGNKAATYAFSRLFVDPTPSARTSYTPESTACAYVKAVRMDDIHQDIKPSGRVLTPPVFAGASIPSKSRSNDEWCIEGRIVSVANDKPIPVEYQGYVAEFMDYLCRPLQPKTLSQVEASQARPTQRANNATSAVNFGFRRPPTEVKSFQKAEIYPEIKDPRNISTLPPDHCYEYSRFTLALADRLKELDWYAFGAHPDVIGKRVQTMANRATTLTETDFSRFDGTHSLALYSIERAVLLRCFPGYSELIVELHDRMLKAPARTKNGVKYDIGGSRLSGAADTSVMNSVDNCLIAYIVHRVQGHSHERALELLGLYGGDDGITPDAPASVYETVATKFGLKLKAFARDSHAPTALLGRIFPYPRTCPTSLADVPRQAAKLHLTTESVASREVVLYNKAVGLLVTDAATPVLGEWARAIVRICGPQTVRLDLQSYLSKEGNLSQEMPRDILVREVARQFKCDEKTITDYCAALDATLTLDAMPLLLDATRPPPPGVVHGDNLGTLSLQTQTLPDKVKPSGQPCLAPPRAPLPAPLQPPPAALPRESQSPSAHPRRPAAQAKPPTPPCGPSSASPSMGSPPLAQSPTAASPTPSPPAPKTGGPKPASSTTSSASPTCASVSSPASPPSPPASTPSSPTPTLCAGSSASSPSPTDSAPCASPSVTPAASSCIPPNSTASLGTTPTAIEPPMETPSSSSTSPGPASQPAPPLTAASPLEASPSSSTLNSRRRAPLVRSLRTWESFEAASRASPSPSPSDQTTGLPDCSTPKSSPESSTSAASPSARTTA